MSRIPGGRRAPAAALASILAAAVLALGPEPATAQNDAGRGSNSLSPESDKVLKSALSDIWASRIRAHSKFLSDDLLEGRGTGRRGGELAAEYIADQFLLMGLGAAVPKVDGTTTYMQPVPLVGLETDANQSLLTFSKDAQTITPTWLDQAVYWSETQQPVSEASSELVFVGYGAFAPEMNWNDFKDVDLTGKILLMLVNDPPSDDPNHFGGKALTYYGRWTYKYWVAAEKGAAGAILIHNTDMAGYGWEVVRNSWGKEKAFMAVDPEGTPPLRLAGWITEDTARQVAGMAGMDLGAMMQAAAKPDFRPMPMGITTTSKVTSNVSSIVTQNIVGFLPGSDPARNREFVIYTAHYDHLGMTRKDGEPAVEGVDDIFNGAQDNSTGVAAMLEIIRAYTGLPSRYRPRRTLLFIATAAEEQGLRGSEHFCARRNLFILPGRMAAVYNLDGISPIGETRDYVFLGADRSPQIKQYVADGASVLEYVPKPDQHPEKGYFYRSDHFNFARIGVPAISIDNGLDYVDQPAGWGEQQDREYTEKRYHQIDDEFDPAWDYKGVAKAAKIAFYLGWRTANDDVMPGWNPGDEFEEERKESLAEVPPDPAPGG